MEKQILISETDGIERKKEPVTMGVPLARGEVTSGSTLTLISENGSILPLQFKPLSLWPDNSFKWILLDFQIDADKHSKKRITLTNRNNPSIDSGYDSIRIANDENIIEVNTGKCLFTIDKEKFKPFVGVTLNGKNIINPNDCLLRLIGESGLNYDPIIEDIKIELNGSLRTVVKFSGAFENNNIKLSEWIATLHFYAGKSIVRLDFTLWNPQPAKHNHGLWDLGDPGSILFQDLSIAVGLKTNEQGTIEYSTQPHGTFETVAGTEFSIFQGSSGGENWRSPVHVNRLDKIPVNVNGYEITKGTDDAILVGGRANPTVGIGDEPDSAAVVIRKFWQNFPHAIRAAENYLSIGLFPEEFNDQYELQGGERKTKTMYLGFGGGIRCIDWVDSPVSSRLSRNDFAASSAIPYLTSASTEIDESYDNILSEMLDGRESFFCKRELIDEFGWRNFGEVYADHEAVGHIGQELLVSHYNNQYDQIYGFFRQYVATGDIRWFELMDDLAKHVYDIDIYYTNGDRQEYNNAFHWHTNHYVDAGTSTHRSLSKKHLSKYNPLYYGGGPGLEHCYATGLMYHYFITGDSRSREAIIHLSDWIIEMMSLPDTFLGTIFDLKKSISSWKSVFGGGMVRADRFPFTRGSGNSISTLLDAHELTKNDLYKLKAEEIIKGCIHPNDDIDSRDLLNAELCWSYTVLLQAIGKYLDAKIELQQFDQMYAYAQKSLLHYTNWMLTNEYPYLDDIDQLEFPNETWPAQDLRKSCVFCLAAKHSRGNQREKYMQKAEFYYKYSVEKLDEFETKYKSRPIALLMQNRWPYPFCSKSEVLAPEEYSEDFQFLEDQNFQKRIDILKSVFTQLIAATIKISIKKEINWYKSRKYNHI